MFEKKALVIPDYYKLEEIEVKNCANIHVMQFKSIFQRELQLTLLLTADYKADVTQVNSSIKEDCN